MSQTLASNTGPSAVVAPKAAQPRLLDVLRETACRKGHAVATLASFAKWVTHFIRFHALRHPRHLQAVAPCGGARSGADLRARTCVPQWNREEARLRTVKNE